MSSQSQFSNAAQVSPVAALIVSGENDSEATKVRKVLNLLGIPWRLVGVGEVVQVATAQGVFCSASALRQLLASAGNGPISWFAGESSVFVFGLGEEASDIEMLRRLTGDAHAAFVEVPGGAAIAMASNPGFCGAMSGLRFALAGNCSERAVRLSLNRSQYEPLLTAEGGILFFRVSHRGVSFYVSAARSVVDLDTRCERAFDVRQAVGAAVPVVIYAKSTFAARCWKSSEIGACLIVDDPLLRPRYGLLKFCELADNLARLKFSTTIAFIPWNWDRVDRRTVQMFRDHVDQLTICLHGCDHTGGEFGTRDSGVLDRKLDVALRRMDCLAQESCLPYDPVMVFPQGAFSAEAGEAMKRSGLAAAANTEVAPCDPASNRTTIGETWKLAMMAYGDFPIFTRRYIDDGLANFAFDTLLGKPCLLVAHHDAFRDGGTSLLDFIAELNRRRWDLRWQPLGALTRRAYKYRIDDQDMRIELYGNRSTIHNDGARSMSAAIFKREQDSAAVVRVMADDSDLPYEWTDGAIHFRCKVPPSSSVEVRVLYGKRAAVPAVDEPLDYHAKVWARRMLSEFRDNYISRSDRLAAATKKLRRFIH